MASPAPFHLLSPVGGATGVLDTTPLVWEASAGAARYLVTIDGGPTNGGFRQWFTTETSAAHGLSLLDGSLVNWAVTAYSAEDETTRCIEFNWTFTLADLRPAPFHLLSPVDGSTSVELSTPLTWEASAGAAQYVVIVDGGPTNGGVRQWSTTETSSDHGLTLADGSFINWAVTAISADGQQTRCIEFNWSFTLADHRPAPFDNLTPPNGAKGVIAGDALTWQPSAGAALDPASGRGPYEVHVGGTPVERFWNVTEPRLVPPNLQNNGQDVYWQVAAFNAHGRTDGPGWTFTMAAGVAGPIWSFTASKPEPPIYVAPLDKATNQPAASVTLEWTQPPNVHGDVTFDVYFGTAAAALSLVSHNQSALTFATGALADGVSYFWRIDARNNVGVSMGPLWTFETRDPTRGLITIAGVDVRERVRIAGLTVRDLLGDTPNTCAFTIEGAAPALGQEVRVGLGSLAGDDVIFGGYIDTVQAVYEGVPENRAWQVTCQDYVWGMNRRKVRTRYAQQSATTIARDLLTFAPSGYTGANIADGLPVVSGGIDYTEEDLTTCFARLAQRIGGYWYVDYSRDVHVFLTEAVDAPAAITRGARVVLDQPAMHWSEDMTQIRTRVYVEGGGSQARGVVAPGSTVLPVTDGGWYSPNGGVVVSGPQRISYASKGAVGGAAAPAAAPLSIAGALSGGPYRYVTSAIVDGNESPLSDPSDDVTIPAVVGPAAALVATPVVGHVTAPSTAPALAPVSTQVSAPSQAVVATGALPTTGEVTAVPANPFALQNVDVGSGALTAGQYQWRATFANAKGETVGGSSQGTSISTTANVTMTIAAAPAGQGITSIKIYRNRTSGSASDLTPKYVGTISPAGGTFKDAVADAARGADIPQTNTTGTPGSGGLVAGNTYYWLVVFVASNGETHAGPARGLTIVGTDTAAQLSSVQTSGDARVVARRIYRTRAGGGAYFLDGTINDNTTTIYLSQKADASLGAALENVNRTGTGKLQPGAAYAWLVTYVTAAGETTAGPGQNITLNASHDTVDLSQIPTSADARVTKRRLYRTAAGGGPYRLETTINDNTTTTYRSGSVGDGSLGVNPPTSNTTGTGGLQPGTYSWTYRYVTATGESEAAAAAVLTVPAGADLVQLTAINPSPDGRVTKRRIYRTTVDGSTLRFEAEINDNTTTTYTSTKRDDQLGADLVDGNTTSANGQIAVSAIAIGPAGTSARRLYRTKSGGTKYQLVVVINDNSTTTYQDNKSDSALGESAAGDVIIQLTGIPASGAGSVLYELRPGDDVNIYVQCDDVDAQHALAALEGPPSLGIVEHFLQDRRVGLSEATAMGHADLRLFARPLVTIDYATRDPKTRSGKTVHIDMPELQLLGDYTIQAVEISEIDQHPGLHPRYHVSCSSVRFSFEDALRRFQLETTTP